MEFLKKIKDRVPEYDSAYEDLIIRFTVVQGGRAGTAVQSASWEQGKFFSTKYEIYMYAVLLGLKMIIGFHLNQTLIEVNSSK